MFSSLIKYYKTGEDKPLLPKQKAIDKLYKKKRLSVILSVIFGYGSFYICRLSLSVAKEPMIQTGVINAEQLGIIGSVLLYVYALGKFTNGFIADRANIRKLMSTFLFVSALINILFGLTSSFFLFLILWALNGWFQSGGSAPSVVSICQWFSNKERGTHYGLWASSHNIGEGITFAVTAVIISTWGWRMGFVVPGLIDLIVAAVLFFTLADRPQTYGLPNVADFKKDYSAGKPSTESVKKLHLMVLKNRYVWILGLSSAFMYVARYAIHSWGPLYFEEIKHYSLATSGLMIGGGTIFGLVGAISSGFISDKLFNSRRNVPTLLYGLLLIASLSVLFLNPPGNETMDIIALGGFEFSIGGLIVFLAGLIAIDFIPKKAAGAVKGVIGLFSYFGAATQDWISGLLIQSGETVVNGKTIYNFNYAFYFWIGAAVLSMLLALLVWNVKPQE